MTSQLFGPNGNVLSTPAQVSQYTRYFPGGEEPPPPPPPPTVANRPWIGSSAPGGAGAGGLAWFNNLQTNIIQRDLNSRTVFYATFTDDLSAVIPDIAAGRVPSISMKEPGNPSDWYDVADAINDLNGFVILTVRHEPENDAGYTYTQFGTDFMDMYDNVKPVAGDNVWMGPVYMAATATNTTRQGYRDLLDTMDFDLVMVDGYNGLYRRSFAQLFNWFMLKARSRTDLNTDPTIAGVPWGVREFGVHGTDVQRANWWNSARIFWEKPENRDLAIVNYFDSGEGDNASIVGWEFRKALPTGWYPQELPDKPPGKLYARAAPPFDPEWVDDLLLPAACKASLATPRRTLWTDVPPVVPPPTPPTYGALALGETNYTYPTDPLIVKFCSPAGNDSAPGTVSLPYRTLQKAVDNTPMDGYVVMRGGEYPEEVTGRWATRMTIQAYPGEAPILRGSNVVTGWIQDNTGPGGIDRWRRTNWNVKFNETPVVPEIVDPAHPEAPWPYQVWIDNVALQQVTTLAGVDASAPDEAGAPGTFWYDRTANVMWIGSTPFNKEVRIAVRQRAFVTPQDNVNGSPAVNFKGIGFYHYATSSNQFAALIIHGNSSHIEHCWVEGCSAGGIFVNRADAVTVMHNTIEHCGQLGGSAFESEHLETGYNRIAYCNRKLFETAQKAGAWKSDTRCHGWKAHHNQLVDNIGHGFWSDILSHFCALWANDIRGGTSSGIHLETSQASWVFGNYFRNCNVGLLNSGSAIIGVWNNTFVDNMVDWSVQSLDNLWVAPAEQFTVISFTGGNNVFARYIPNNSYKALSVTDPHGGTNDIDEMEWTINYSAAYRATAGTSKYADVLKTTGQTSYATQDLLQAGTSPAREVNGIWQDGGSDPYLQADKSTPVAFGPLIETGTAVPGIVSDRLGWSPEQIATPNRGWL